MADVGELLKTLQTVNRNILAAASLLDDQSHSYTSLLGEAAGIRMAIRFVEEWAQQPEAR